MIMFEVSIFPCFVLSGRILWPKCNKTLSFLSKKKFGLFAKEVH